MNKKFRIIWFWLVAFRILLWNTLKGNDWHFIMVDLHLGDESDGRPIRKKLIAKRSVHGFDIYQDDITSLLIEREKQKVMK